MRGKRGGEEREGNDAPAQAKVGEDFFCVMLPAASSGSLRGLILCHDTVRSASAG